MKLISLNIWGGLVLQPLLDFFSQQQDVDIFCLQEVYHNASAGISTDDEKYCLDIFAKVEQLLPEHEGLFLPIVNGIYGIAMFVRQGIEVIAHGNQVIHEAPDYTGRGPAHPRYLQWVQLRNAGKEYVVVNVHGLWNGKGKTDSPERLVQSQHLRQFMDETQLPMIVCGDFNLRPDTESLKIISQGYQDLIVQHGVTDTRTSFYEKAERFADYVFASDDITVSQFAVLPDQVSDHSPLLIQFE